MFQSCSTPSNVCFGFSYYDPIYDRLSVNLRQLSMNLTDLRISCLQISASMFWPQESEPAGVNRPMLNWPHLKKFLLTYRTIDASGNWLFGPHPDFHRLDFEPDDEEEAPDKEQVTEKEMQRMKEKSWLNDLHCQPTWDMEHLYKEAARAPKAMPRLEKFVIAACESRSGSYYHEMIYLSFHTLRYLKKRWSKYVGNRRRHGSRRYG